MDWYKKTIGPNGITYTRIKSRDEQQPNIVVINKKKARMIPKGLNLHVPVDPR
ncbi:MAG: hypothetical protein ABH967_00070 [Patescibacteria group bacterium]